MIDALIYAVRDGIRAAKIGYQNAEVEVMDDERPPPRCGNFFVSINGGAIRSDRDNQLHEWYEFNVTLTMRVTVPLDRTGDQQIYRNLIRETARQQGFYAKAEQLRALLHMNWDMTVKTGQLATLGYLSANDNLVAWSTTASGNVYGFCEPMRFLSMEAAKLVGGEWFSAEPDAEDVGVKSTMKFGRCRRFQPQTAAQGPFI